MLIPFSVVERTRHPLRILVLLLFNSIDLRLRSVFPLPHLVLLVNPLRRVSPVNPLRRVSQVNPLLRVSPVNPLLRVSPVNPLRVSQVNHLLDLLVKNLQVSRDNLKRNLKRSHLKRSHLKSKRHGERRFQLQHYSLLPQQTHLFQLRHFLRQCLQRRPHKPRLSLECNNNNNNQRFQINRDVQFKHRSQPRHSVHLQTTQELLRQCPTDIKTTIT